MTLEEILKAKGQTPEQIQAILTAVGPAKSIFEETLQSAEQKNTEARATLAEAEEFARKYRCHVEFLLRNAVVHGHEEEKSGKPPMPTYLKKEG